MKKIISVLLLSVALFATGNVNAQIKKKPIKKTVRANTKPVAKQTAAAKKDTVQERFTRVNITTDLGEIVIKLYNKTPKHRDNFIKLVNEHFYDSLLFHRVISNFMIQGGDPKSKQALAGEMLGMGDVGYTIPAEFDSSLYHKRGALCAARTENPEKASSGCQFYIVQGKLSNDTELDNIQTYNQLRYTPAQRMTYKMKGGTPFLDMKYTVFGEVESGMDVVDRIAQVQKDNGNRPVQDIRMKMDISNQPVVAKPDAE